MANERTSNHKILHEKAVAEGQDFYEDPETGLWVTTELALLRRECCRNGCRHCPYGFDKEIEIEKGIL